MIKNPGDPGCTCYRLRQAARVASRIYDQALAPVGVNIGQFGLLATLSEMNGASITQVAAVLEMERTTLTRNLVPLQRRGYVVSGRESDARARALVLTTRGRKVLKSAIPLWEQAQKRVATSLGLERTKALHALLEDSIDRIGRAERNLARPGIREK